MKLNNGVINVEIADHGAELKSVIKNGREYMWNADPKYWNRTSPVLFPFVGGFKGNTYKYNGKEYPAVRHGFARDCEFKLVESTDTSATYLLQENEATLEKYPFKFDLLITYELDVDTVTVKWVVKNTNDCDMYFSIGAHPAFNLMLDKNYFKFDTDKDISYKLIDSDGFMVPDVLYTLENDGYAEYTSGMFNKDAFIIEGEQAKVVSLCDKDKNEYVRVTFDAPLFGLWQPVGFDVPFVCIEPWYGRCDRNDFNGNLSERDYTNSLKSGEIFETQYQMKFL